MSTRHIFGYYVLMLVVQLFIELSTVALSEVIFLDFSTTFECPTADEPFPDDWPLNESVVCSFRTLRFTLLLRYLDYGLLTVAVLVTLYGLLWCFIRHHSQLGSKEIALFAFTSGLSPDSYVFPNFVTSKRRSCLNRLLSILLPRFENDLDFLIARLYKSDSGMGAVFKNVQIYRQIKYYKDNDRELLHVFMETQRYHHIGSIYRRNKAPKSERAVNSDIPMHRFFWKKDVDASFLAKVFYNHLQQNPEHGADFVQFFDRKLGNIKLLKWHGNVFQSIRDRFYAYTLLAADNQLALDISFGTGLGYNLELAHVFRRVLSLRFDPAFRNEEKVFYKENFATNFTTIKVVEDVFSRGDEKFDRAIASVFGLAPKKPKKKKTGQATATDLEEGGAEDVDGGDEATDLLTALRRSVRGLKSKDQAKDGEDEDSTCDVTEESTSDGTGDVKRINFIVVGPIMDPTKMVSANILLEKLNTPHPGPYLIDDDAILLAIRPLFIERKDVTNVFHKYKPPEWLVDIESELGIDLRDKDQRKAFDANYSSKLKRVGDGRGFPIKCGDTYTVFEFSTYKFDREASFHYLASDPSKFSEEDIVEVRGSDSTKDSDLTVIECESTV